MRKEKLVTGEHYHVYNRGTNKCLLFHEDADRRFFLFTLKKYLALGGVGVAAFVMMNNHFHFAVRQDDDGAISRLFRRLCGEYAMYFNWKYERTGCLFSGRFHAKRVTSDAYFLWLTRYIHRNPLEILNGKKLETYRWSSYRHYLGLEHMPCIDSEMALSMIGGAEKYRHFVETGTDDGVVPDS